uniref:Tetraspanin n=1 Tax=Parastrongyloides trichosuri TaxID=131310 RepID=A0A0N4ZMT9_PARTI
MVYGCGNQLIKFFVFASNFLIFTFGAVIFSISLWANLDTKFSIHLREYFNSLNLDDSYVEELAKYQASLWVLVAIGALLLFVGFLGCCGACSENSVLLTLYGIILFILTLIQIGAIVMALMSRPEFEEIVLKALKYSAKDDLRRKQLLPIEKAFQCCGATPDTKELFIQLNECPEGFTEYPDCYTAITDLFSQKSEILAVVGLLLIIIQFFGIIFSCVLCKAFRERGPAYYA